MKRGLLLAATAVAGLSLAACNKQTAADATSATTGVAANAADSAGQAVDKAQDAMSAPVGQTSAATLGSHDTGAYVSNAAQSDMYEVSAGKIAQERGKSADVKAFGKMMVHDHTATTAAMKPLASAAGQTPPAGLDQRRQGLLDNLKSAPAADFDKTYIDQQVAAHQEALTLHQGYADNGDDAGLKAFAGKTAPKVQTHLDRAKSLQAGLK